jgi:hypothetical protein
MEREEKEAAILEAVQAQAAVEEEIGSRLPREVLNINKKLERQ